MSIRDVDSTGFVVFTTHEGVEVRSARFEYHDIGVACDESGVPETSNPRWALALWAIRNGLSQAFTDTGAGKKLLDRRSSFDAKLERFRKGLVPSEAGGRGPALTELEREVRAVVEAFLRSRGQKAGEAKELASDPDAVAEQLAAALQVAKGGEAAKYKAEYIDRWTKAAQKRLDDAKGLEISDEEAEILQA